MDLKQKYALENFIIGGGFNLILDKWVNRGGYLVCDHLCEVVEDLIAY